MLLSFETSLSHRGIESKSPSLGTGICSGRSERRDSDSSRPGGVRFRRCQRPLLGCAVGRRRFPVGESPTRRNAPAGSNRSNCGGNETVEAFGEAVTKYGDGASVQAVTRVNAEQASKRTMRGPTRNPNRGRLIRLGKRADEAPSRRAGVLATACTQGKAQATREAPRRGQR
jgi:hypothetical protein